MRLTQRRLNGLARYEVARRMRERVPIGTPLAQIAYGERGVPADVVRDLIAARWIAAVGVGQGYTTTESGRALLAKRLECTS